jgi:Spy/CpxP family protein refolding chaperone
MLRRYLYPMAALAFGLVIIFGQTASAQGRHHGRAQAGRMVRFGQELGLTDAQRTQAKAIAQETHQRIQQVLTPEQQASAQARPRCTPRKDGARALALTEEQKTQMQRIHQDAREKAKAIRAQGGETQAQLFALREATRAQVRQVLTPEQQATLTAARPVEGKERMHQRNLTPEQQVQMRTIHTDGATKFRAILTPEQQAKFDAHRAQRNGRHPHTAQ